MSTSEIVSTMLALFGIVISFFALNVARKSEKATERQAISAEAQARAIPAQLAAAELAAAAAKQQADLALETAKDAKKIAQLS